MSTVDLPDVAAKTQPWSGRKLHFVGIGGAGMSGLALIARQLGADISGSDRTAESPYQATLARAGVTQAVGHAAENVPGGAEIVVSTAVPFDNPERVLARERGLNELHRADLLGELTELKPTIAVAGTHGKTTTTAMIVHALRACGMDPSYVVGGEVRSTGSNAEWGSGEWLVVEADESDRSLLKLSADIAVLTNAELDHHTTYASVDEVFDIFREFLARADQVVVWDRPELIELAGEFPRRSAERESLLKRFDVADPEMGPGGVKFESEGVSVELDVPGEHNARNAAAALAACVLAGADPEQAAAALKSFDGTGRRFEYLGLSKSGAVIVDDYAHHPTEVQATLDAARTLGHKRVVAVFQPHLFSRTVHEGEGFGTALATADLAVISEIYPARENPADYPGVSGKMIADVAAASTSGSAIVAWMPELDEVLAFLESELRDGDICVTLGAGDVNSIGKRLVG